MLQEKKNTEIKNSVYVTLISAQSLTFIGTIKRNEADVGKITCNENNNYNNNNNQRWHDITFFSDDDTDTETNSQPGRLP